MLYHPRRNLTPAIELQLAKDALDVRLDRPRGQHQLDTDLSVAQSLRDEAGNLLFAPSQN